MVHLQDLKLSIYTSIPFLAWHHGPREIDLEICLLHDMSTLRLHMSSASSVDPLGIWKPRQSVNHRCWRHGTTSQSSTRVNLNLREFTPTYTINNRRSWKGPVTYTSFWLIKTMELSTHSQNVKKLAFLNPGSEMSGPWSIRAFQ